MKVANGATGGAKARAEAALKAGTARQFGADTPADAPVVGTFVRVGDVVEMPKPDKADKPK